MPETGKILLFVKPVAIGKFHIRGDNVCQSGAAAGAGVDFANNPCVKQQSGKKDRICLIVA